MKRFRSETWLLQKAGTHLHKLTGVVAAHESTTPGLTESRSGVESSCRESPWGTGGRTSGDQRFSSWATFSFCAKLLVPPTSLWGHHGWISTGLRKGKGKGESVKENERWNSDSDKEHSSETGHSDRAWKVYRSQRTGEKLNACQTHKDS